MWILALICHTKAVINAASQHTEPAVSSIRIQTWPKQSSQAVRVLRVCPRPLKAWNPRYVPDQIRRWYIPCPFVSLSPWPERVWIHIALPNENDHSNDPCFCTHVLAGATVAENGKCLPRASAGDHKSRWCVVVSECVRAGFSRQTLKPYRLYGPCNGPAVSANGKLMGGGGEVILTVEVGVLWLPHASLLWISRLGF